MSLSGQSLPDVSLASLALSGVPNSFHIYTQSYIYTPPLGVRWNLRAVMTKAVSLSTRQIDSSFPDPGLSVLYYPAQDNATEISVTITESTRTGPFTHFLYFAITLVASNGSQTVSTNTATVSWSSNGCLASNSC